MGEETISELATEEDSIKEAIVKAGLLDEVVTADESAEDMPLAENLLASEDALVAADESAEDMPLAENLLASEDAPAPEETSEPEDASPPQDVSAPEETSTQDTTTPEDASAPEDDRKWYVVHCYSGYENKVKRNLEQRISSMDMEGYIFDVVVPTEEEIEVREGKRRTYQRRVFPGYILVQMIMTDSSWYVVRNTPGVTGFVGMGSKPTPLREEEVQRIIKRMEAEAPKVKVTFKPGQKVRIIQGPFADFIGTVDDINMEKGKVRVMVSFFGRETPVELDFLQVEKV